MENTVIIGLFHEMFNEFRKKSLKMLFREIHHFHVNALVHSVIVFEGVKKCGYRSFDNPLQPTYLSPSDYHLSSRMKSELRGKSLMVIISEKGLLCKVSRTNLHIMLQENIVAHYS